MNTLMEILFGKKTKDANTTRQIVVPETTLVQETLQESTVMSETTATYPAIYQFTTKPTEYQSGASIQANTISSIIRSLGKNAVISEEVNSELIAGCKYIVRGAIKLTSTDCANELKNTIEDGYSLNNSIITQLKTAEPKKEAMTIYQFESKPMTVEETEARVANINCILEAYQGNIASKNFAAYATRKTQVQMKDLLDSKNLLVAPEEFIAGVITVNGQNYAGQIRGTIESMLPMKQSALTYQGKSLDEKVEETTKQ